MDAHSPASYMAHSKQPVLAHRCSVAKLRAQQQLGIVLHDVCLRPAISDDDLPVDIRNMAPYLTYHLPLLDCYRGAGPFASHEVCGSLALKAGPSPRVLFCRSAPICAMTSADSERTDRPDSTGAYIHTPHACFEWIDAQVPDLVHPQATVTS